METIDVIIEFKLVKIKIISFSNFLKNRSIYYSFSCLVTFFIQADIHSPTRFILLCWIMFVCFYTVQTLFVQHVMQTKASIDRYRVGSMLFSDLLKNHRNPRQIVTARHIIFFTDVSRLYPPGPTNVQAVKQTSKITWRYANNCRVDST